MLHDLRHLGRLHASDHSSVPKLFPQNIRGLPGFVEVGENVNVVDHQAEHNKRLKGDEPPEVVHLGKRVKTGIARVTKVIQNDYGHHEEGISDGEDVERGAAEVLGLHIEVQISLLSRVVVVLEQELVNGQEGGPVASVGVDQEREGTQHMLMRLVSIVEGRQEKHQNYLYEAKEYLGESSRQGGQSGDPWSLLPISQSCLLLRQGHSLLGNPCLS